MSTPDYEHLEFFVAKWYVPGCLTWKQTCEEGLIGLDRWENRYVGIFGTFVTTPIEYQRPESIILFRDGKAFVHTVEANHAKPS